MGYKNWNISTKIGLIFVLFVALMFANFLVVYTYKGDAKLAHDVMSNRANENPLLVEKLSSIATIFIYKGDTSPIRDLYSCAARHDENLQLLREGGIVEFLDKEVEIVPLPNLNVLYLTNVEAFWKEFRTDIIALAEKRHFINSIGQYYRWNKEIKREIGSKNTSKMADFKLFELQEAVNLYLQEDIEVRWEIYELISEMDAIVATSTSGENSSLRQVWYSYRFHLRTLLESSKEIGVLHHVANNSKYLIDMEEMFKLSLSKEIIRLKQASNEALLSVLLILLGIDLVLLFIGFHVVNHFVIKPIKQLKGTALRIKEGYSAEAFDVNYEDELGALAIRLNKMYDRLRGDNQMKPANTKDLTKSEEFSKN